jgi:cell division protein FtsB
MKDHLMTAYKAWRRFYRSAWMDILLLLCIAYFSFTGLILLAVLYFIILMIRHIALIAEERLVASLDRLETATNALEERVNEEVEQIFHQVETEINEQGQQVIVPGSFTEAEEKVRLSPLALLTVVPRALGEGSADPIAG